MHVLIIGNGGREHALAKKIALSELVLRVSVSPGNVGTFRAQKTQNVSLLGPKFQGILDFVVAEKVDLVVIGPEAPLVAGLADLLRAKGIATIGPDQSGARLEGSKTFAKMIMQEANVPTARSATVSTAKEVDAFIDSFDGKGLVVKADGLAGGKGVLILETLEEARKAAKTMLETRPFGDASEKVLLEERLYGPEVSYIVLTDGTNYVTFPSSQDHKRLLDGDNGPNTGGMGAYTPVSFVTKALAEKIEYTIIDPVLASLRARGIDYRGFLYAGLMLTKDGPKVLEFNVRLGDPETQVLLSAIDDDIVPALLEAATGSLSVQKWSSKAAATVVLAAEGYPRSPKKGSEISGIEAAEKLDQTSVIHAGVKENNGKFFVNGGRVLSVVSSGETVKEALKRAYAGVAQISWTNMHYRKDIGPE